VLFNSYSFLFVFLPLTLIGWWTLRPKNVRLAFLTLASWFFYSWWDWRYLPILVSATLVTYLAALAIARSEDERRRRLLLAGCLTVNLGTLGYFKYAGFFVHSLDGISKSLGIGVHAAPLHILLPIGISFYTFNAMSYVIDVYRREIAPTRNPLEYSTFVSLFPHLIAGPIVRFSTMAKQLKRPTPALASDNVARGLYFLSCGLVKKLLIADQLSPHVNWLFLNSGHLGLVSSWAAAIGYSLQLYFDFSGYSDMAVGLAWLLGFQFPQNFNSPFKSVNISDFWRRWHMSLSTWIRDYVFIPLGGSRGSSGRTAVNLAVAMFLGGLWHGAAWTFVVWGLLHGIYLGGHALLRQAGLTPKSVAFNRVITFGLVAAAFVIFRAPNFTTAGQILSSMVGFGGFDSLGQLHSLVPGGFALLLVALLVFVNVAPNTWEIRIVSRIRYGFVVGVGAALAVLTIAHPHPFIYFQF
jgi:alginate O-acetyltransferase complex protein AlgI